MHVQTQRLTGGRTCRRWRGSSTELGTTTNCGGTRGRLCEHCTAPHHARVSHASLSHRCLPPVTCIRVTSLSPSCHMHTCHIFVTSLSHCCHSKTLSHHCRIPQYFHTPVTSLAHCCHTLLHHCHVSVVTCLSVHRYPAGFVYIYSIFYHVTERGDLIGRAQYIFALLYLLNLALVCNIYRKTAKASNEY